MSLYRLRCTYTYSNATMAQMVVNGLNTNLSTFMNPVTAARATLAGSTVDLTVNGLTEAQARALYVNLTGHVFSQTRGAGKFSLVRTPEAG